MNATLLQNELLALAGVTAGPCISLYAPMESAGDTAQNQVRAKNLLREARRALERFEHGGDMLQPLEQLLLETPFWSHQSQGFAAFLNPHQFHTFKVPVQVPEQVTVGDHFHLKPLVPLLTRNGRFYVLALSQHQVRLLDCSPAGQHQLTLPDEVPQNIEEVRRFEDASGVDEGQMTHNRHNRTSGRPGPSGSPHGMGITNNALHEYRLRFLRQVEQGLQPMWRGAGVPLVLAGVDELIHEFRGIFSYPNVLEDFLAGNFDELNSAELQRKAWPIAQAYFQRGEEQAMGQYQLALSRQLATSDIEQIMPAAYDGRIGTLFVAGDRDLWGHYRIQERTLERLHADHPRAQDLLDLAALETLNKGGEVFVVDQARLPDAAADLCAILRY